MVTWLEPELTSSYRHNHVALEIKSMPAKAGDRRDMGSIPGSGRSAGGRHDNSLQYSYLENPHGQRSLVGYSPRDLKESDTSTEQVSVHTRTSPKVRMLKP